MIRTVCLVSNKKSHDDNGKHNKGIVAIMRFFGNAEVLLQHYIEEEKEKLRIEKERI